MSRSWLGRLSRSSQPVVFWTSVVLVVLFVSFGAAFPRLAASSGAASLAFVTHNFGWQLCITVTGLLLFCVFVGLSPWGSIKLGADDQAPEFGTLTWFAMLFSAGMGIGLLFYGVAEPLLHFHSAEQRALGAQAAAREAMGITMFHWGLHAWAVYAVVALSLAYPAFRLGQPLAFRSTLRPILGNRVDGAWGHGVDILAVFATLFGLATSLGLGARQINAGMHQLFGASILLETQVSIIVVVTLAATASVLSGLHAGVRRLSEVNMLLAAALLLFVVAAGPTAHFVAALGETSVAYLGSLLTRSIPLRLTEWHTDWTLFYWAWWIAWSPFVGTFIARVSKGRTVRELILGVLLVPTLLGIVWFTAFGSCAIHLDQGSDVDLIAVVDKDASLAVFAFLSELPGSQWIHPLTTLLVATFFVTSSDSGSLVVDMLTSGGHLNPSLWQRTFWALTEGAVAATLLVVGGLKAMQAASVSVGLPLSVILILMAWGLTIRLRQDPAREPQRVEGQIERSTKC